MKFKTPSFFYTILFMLRKRWFIFQQAKRYLYPEFARQFFVELWNSAYAAQKLLVTPKLTAANLPIVLVVGKAQSGKTALLEASRHILPQSSYLNSDFQPVLGQPMPQYYLTTHQCYIEIPEYFFVHDSAQNIPYLEQLMRFWHAVGDDLRIKKIILTTRLSDLFSAEKTIQNQNERFWAGLSLLLAHVPAIELVCVVTEIDRLPGFNEFFSDLSLEERQHAFGFKLTSEINFLAQLRSHCMLMKKRLRQRMWWRCRSEAILTKRLLAAEFPSQFAAFCEALLGYFAPLQNILNNNPSVKIKACCFTSALQKGNSIELLFQGESDLLLAEAATQHLILAQNREYFISGFFHKFLSVSPIIKTHHATRMSAVGIKRFFLVLISCTLLAVVGEMGIVFWNIAHLRQVLLKQPVIAYKILASDFAQQNLKTFVAYESWGLPGIVQNQLLHEPKLAAWIQHGAKIYLNQRWRADVYGFYSENIARRAPLVVNASQEASVKNFNILYAPTGLLMQFKKNYLQNRSVQNLLQENKSLTQLYAQLSQLQTLFYPDNQNFQLSFILYSNRLANDAHSVNFMISGKNVLLKNNVLTSQIFNLPDYAAIQDSGYSVQYLHQLPTVRLFKGAWSWLKLFGVLHWQKIDENNNYLVRSDHNDFSVKVSANIPLSTLPEMFEHLSLPEQI